MPKANKVQLLVRTDERLLKRLERVAFQLDVRPGPLLERALREFVTREERALASAKERAA